MKTLSTFALLASAAIFAVSCKKEAQTNTTISRTSADPVYKVVFLGDEKTSKNDVLYVNGIASGQFKPSTPSSYRSAADAGLLKTGTHTIQLTGADGLPRVKGEIYVYGNTVATRNDLGAIEIEQDGGDKVLYIRLEP